MIIVDDSPSHTDLVDFTYNIREKDWEEVQRQTGFFLKGQLYVALIRHPGVSVIRFKDDIIGVGGVEKVRGHNYVIGWMLLTDKVEKHKIAFLRWSKEYVQMLLRHYIEIRNMVWYGNTLHVQYLNWLGAIWYKADEGKDFRRFKIKRRKE